MPRTNFRQRDLERILRAAKSVGARVEIDLRSLVVTVIPTSESGADPQEQIFVRDGEENWDD